MADVASRELRNSTRALLDRVEAGESVTITVDGRPVALLSPISHRPRWIQRNEFAALLVSAQADHGLSSDLQDLAGEMTDERELE